MKRIAYKAKESEIQRAIIQWLSYLPECFVIRSNNIGVPVLRKDGTQGFRPSPVKGLSDLLVVYQGRFIALEVKTPEGRLSKNQQCFLESVKMAGGIGEVVRSIGDVEEVFARISNRKGWI